MRLFLTLQEKWRLFPVMWRNDFEDFYRRIFREVEAIDYKCEALIKA
jgi:hypothetical protein